MNNAKSKLPGTITGPSAMEISILISAIADKRAMIAGTKSVLRLNALQQDLRTVQQRLAVLFGATRGWALSRSDFTAAVLARRGLFDGRGYFGDPGHGNWSIIRSTIAKTGWHPPSPHISMAPLMPPNGRTSLRLRN